MPGANWPQSLITTQSQASLLAILLRRTARGVALPTSSSPSIRNFTCSGSLPTVLIQASTLLTCVSIWPLSSVAPRA